MLIAVAGSVGLGLVWGWVGGLRRSAQGASWRALALCLAGAGVQALGLYIITNLWYTTLLFCAAFLVALFAYELWRFLLRRGLETTDSTHV